MSEEEIFHQIITSVIKEDADDAKDCEETTDLLIIKKLKIFR